MTDVWVKFSRMNMISLPLEDVTQESVLRTFNSVVGVDNYWKDKLEAVFGEESDGSLEKPVIIRAKACQASLGST